VRLRVHIQRLGTGLGFHRLDALELARGDLANDGECAVAAARENVARVEYGGVDTGESAR
jgi:hypothetical protein